ncbi:hypothetical protein J6590_002068 [Homalodisca vitripennis]|nr:hypothetical protein J6590_002068 [Homalodisca vitripennis]
MESPAPVVQDCCFQFRSPVSPDVAQGAIAVIEIGAVQIRSRETAHAHYAPMAIINYLLSIFHRQSLLLRPLNSCVRRCAGLLYNKGPRAHLSSFNRRSTGVVKAQLVPINMGTLSNGNLTVLQPERTVDGLTVVAVNCSSPTDGLHFLDKSLASVTLTQRVALVLSSNPQQPPGLTTLPLSKTKCHIVSDANDLLHFIPENQTPSECGGRTTHDQLEWVEFFKVNDLSVTQTCIVGQIWWFDNDILSSTQ